MRSRLVAAAFLLVSAAALADQPPQCRISDFPSNPTDAWDRVGFVVAVLAQRERENPYSYDSAKAFRKSVRLCTAKWGEARTVDRARCETWLICSRIGVLSGTWW
jgi:hypothetical protein